MIKLIYDVIIISDRKNADQIAEHKFEGVGHEKGIGHKSTKNKAPTHYFFESRKTKGIQVLFLQIFKNFVAIRVPTRSHLLARVQ